MKTIIYKNKAAFDAREDKSLNGVDQAFADNNPGWDRNLGNAACWNCSRCSGCSDCSDCSYCSYCSDCRDCSNCSGCFRCSECSRCSGCSECSYCSNCSGCFRCSECSRCSGCSECRDLKDVKQECDVPVIENIHQKVLEAVTAKPECFDMEDWHSECGTTHCRAGWVVELGGPKAKAIEKKTNTPFAAMLVYKASSPSIPILPTRFHDSKEAALADIRRCAELEKQSL